MFCWDHPPDERENDDTKNRFGLARPGVMSLEQFTKIVDDLYQLGRAVSISSDAASRS